MKYDVALSFAGENRKYVEAVANELKRLGVSVFYDDFETVDLWGKDLFVHLQDIYQNQAKYTVVFLSEYYAKKHWANHERKAAQARAFNENKEYILPARFDRTEIPGILSTTGYIDLNKYTPEKFADLIKEKVAQTVKEKNPSQEQIKRKPFQYVLIAAPEYGSMLIEDSKIERAANKLILTFTEPDAKSEAFFSNLSKRSNNNFIVAYKQNAFRVKLISFTQNIEDSKEIWKLELETLENNYSSAYEAAYGNLNLSANQLAEMKARRILLNEKSTNSPVLANQKSDEMSILFLEAMLRANFKFSSSDGSLLPEIYESITNKETFLEMARLTSVYMLKLSGVVEHIYKLDMELIESHRLKISFEGVRPKRYVNEKPYEIQFEGICDLSKKQ